MDIPLFKHVPGPSRGSPGTFRRSRSIQWSWWLEGISAAVLIAVFFSLTFRSIHRSLWLDEAWVANSLRQSWPEMFWGGEWLQTSPPLFLVFARALVNAFGLSTETLRAIPLLLAAIAGIAIYRAVRIFWAPLAPLACAAVLFPRLAVEYFGAFKQYGGEAAAVALVLWAAFHYAANGGTRGLSWLAAALIGLLPLAYPLVFVAPGIVWLVYQFNGWRLAAGIAASFSVMLGVLYFVFIRPNVAPVLWTYWNVSAGDSFEGTYSPAMWALVAVLVAALIWAWRNQPLVLVCLAPCALLVLAEQAGWYPMSARTRLFTRPCVVLGISIFLSDIITRRAHQLVGWCGNYSRTTWSRWEIGTAVASAVLTIALAGSALRFDVTSATEDYAGAVAYLCEHVQANEPVLINAAANQGMRLYFAMAQWQPADVRWGDTSWPCCSRTHPSEPGGATKEAMQRDLDRLLTPAPSARVWVVYSNRPTHWRYTGVDEGNGWREDVWRRGCPPEVYVDQFTNIVISPQLCGAQ